MTGQLPDVLIPHDTSPVFTADTLPADLQAEHTLEPGHWGALAVLEGGLRFVNVETGEERPVSAPDVVTIHPGVPHKLVPEGRLHCRIDYYLEQPADSVEDEGTTIGDIMDSAAEIGTRGVRTIGAGVGAAAKAVWSVPRFVRRVAGKDDAETPPEQVIVEGLPDDLMKRYLSVLVWLVHADDKRIDERELCEIQLVMTKRGCDADVRKAVREHLENPRRPDARTLVDHILAHGPESGTDAQMALKCALMNDAIRLVRATSDGPAREHAPIGRLAEMLELDDEKVRFLKEACIQDEKILDGDLSDARITALAKGTAARAAAVGVPIGAIYVSGSVAGLSAAGIASGLATLGMGGVLGLSAMVSGIGVVVIVGGVAYHGVRWLLGGSRRNRESLREMMLQEVLRLHQTAIINLGEDMSHFGRRIADLTRATDMNRGAIDALSREVMLLSGALAQLGRRANRFEQDLHGASGQATP